MAKYVNFAALSTQKVHYKLIDFLERRQKQMRRKIKLEVIVDQSWHSNAIIVNFDPDNAHT